MYKVLFSIFLFFIFHYLFFISGVKNDTISIFAQNMTNQIEKLNSTESFITNAKSYLQVIAPNNSTVKSLITFNDILSNGYVFPRVPDGLGLIQNRDGLVDIFVNHELALDEVNEYAKVSKLTVDKTGMIISGELIEDGSGKYERFCSATIFNENGFKNPLFVTNEEIEEGIVVAYDTVTKNKTEMPWLGKLSHENTILVPNKNNKTIVFTTEDGEPNHSQLYMFISDNPTNFLNGIGQLYVLIGENNITSFQDLQKGITYNGYFHPVTWNWMTQNSTELENEVQRLNALDFIRLEDADYNKVESSSIIYITDTGSDEFGERYQDGRLYQFEIIEPSFNRTNNANVINNTNNYKVKISIILDGDDGDDLRNPDNIATSEKSIMIQEDLNDYNIIDGGVNARVLKYDFTSHNLTPVAIVDQSQDISHPKAGEWESSGIIEVFDIFGKGYWLLDIQAHTLGEGGQLLLMNSPGS
jgi:Bacterial protein of unknown function (DUF839)